MTLTYQQCQGWGGRVGARGLLGFGVPPLCGRGGGIKGTDLRTNERLAGIYAVTHAPLPSTLLYPHMQGRIFVWLSLFALCSALANLRRSTLDSRTLLAAGMLLLFASYSVYIQKQ